MNKTLKEIIDSLKITGDKDEVYKNQQKKFKDMLVGLGIYNSFNTLYSTKTGYAFDKNGSLFVKTLFSHFETATGKNIRSSKISLEKKLRSEQILLENLLSKEILDLLDNFISCIKASENIDKIELIKEVETSALYQRCKMNYILHLVYKQFNKTVNEISNPEDIYCINAYIWNKISSLNKEWSLIRNLFDEYRSEEISNNAIIECKTHKFDSEVEAALNLSYMIANDGYKNNPAYKETSSKITDLEQYISDCKKRKQIENYKKTLEEIETQEEEKYFNNLLKTMDEKTAEYYKNIYYKYIKNGELENILSKDEINYHEPPQKVLNDILSDLDIN